MDTIFGYGHHLEGYLRHPHVGCKGSVLESRYANSIHV